MVFEILFANTYYSKTYHFTFFSLPPVKSQRSFLTQVFITYLEKENNIPQGSTCSFGRTPILLDYNMKSETLL